MGVLVVTGIHCLSVVVLIDYWTLVSGACGRALMVIAELDVCAQTVVITIGVPGSVAHKSERLTRKGRLLKVRTRPGVMRVFSVNQVRGR